jgi:hypothetical protein
MRGIHGSRGLKTEHPSLENAFSAGSGFMDWRFLRVVLTQAVYKFCTEFHAGN